MIASIGTTLFPRGKRDNIVAAWKGCIKNLFVFRSVPGHWRLYIKASTFSIYKTKNNPHKKCRAQVSFSNSQKLIRASNGFHPTMISGASSTKSTSYFSSKTPTSESTTSVFNILTHSQLQPKNYPKNSKKDCWEFGKSDAEYAPTTLSIARKKSRKVSF